MDLPWGDPRTVQFVTNVGLITSNGPNGKNIMTAEWTHQVSYSPGLIAVCIGLNKATLENIKATKEFGVSLASQEQAEIASIAGGSSGKKVDKIKAMEELGYSFYKAKHINVPMVKGASLNAECKVVNEIVLGDHVMFVGEILEATASSEKDSLIYHKLNFWKFGGNAEKPSEQRMAEVKKTVDNNQKSTA